MITCLKKMQIMIFTLLLLLLLYMSPNVFTIYTIKLKIIVAT